MNQVRPRLPEYWEPYIEILKAMSQEDVDRIFGDDDRVVKKVFDTQTGHCEVKMQRPITSLEDALEFFEVDTDVWEPAGRMEVTAWDVTIKDNEGNPRKRTNYRTFVPLRKIQWQFDREKFIKSLSKKIVSPKVKRIKKTGGVVVDFAIKDFHLGKIGFDEKTFEYNWSIKEAKGIYNDCVDYFLSEVGDRKIDHFVFECGDDFYHIDGVNNTTTRGTNMPTAEHWEKLFVHGHELATHNIDKLSRIAPVEVFMIPGNHDYQSVVSLGEVLKMRYRNNPNVTIHNSFTSRKYHLFGDVLLGFLHGDGIKENTINTLPMIDVPDLVGKSKYRYIHLGHWHKNKLKTIKGIDTVYSERDEPDGFEVEWCPSLSPTDKWHYNKAFTGKIRRAKAFVFHPKKGKIMDLYYNL